jgi:tRNA G18 (ribose-2'-O)-methylase SpoU
MNCYVCIQVIGTTLDSSQSIPLYNYFDHMRSGKSAKSVISSSNSSQTQSEGGQPYNQPPVIIVLGNEGFGIRTNILNRCDVLIRIEDKTTLNGVTSTNSSNSTGNALENVESLNVSVSCGIMLYYFLYQIRMRLMA